VRASLASATSLLALLLLEGPEVAAAPIITAGAPIPFSYVFDSTADAGTETPSPSNAIGTYTFTPVTTASAPSDRAAFNPYLPVSQSPPANRVAPNTPDSQLLRSHGGAETGGASNSVFVGTGGDVPLLDNPFVVPTAASASFNYTIPTPPKDADSPRTMTTPADRDDQTTSDTETSPSTYTPLDREIATSQSMPGESNPPSAGANVSPPAPGTRNRSGIGAASIETTPGSIETATVSGRRPPLANGSAGPASPRTASAMNQASARKAFDLTLQRIIREARRSNDSLTADGYAIDGMDLTAFNVSSVSAGSVVTRDTIVPIPIKVVGTGVGELPSSLTIFVDE
jgi:hypothetical protein